MASALNHKYNNSCYYTKIHSKPKKVKYSIGKMESGLSTNLAKKLLNGTCSISNEMIKIEIDKNKQLKRTIKRLKKELEELKMNRGSYYKYKKLKTLIRIKKVEYFKTKSRVKV